MAEREGITLTTLYAKPKRLKFYLQTLAKCRSILDLNSPQETIARGARYQKYSIGLCLKGKTG